MFKNSVTLLRYDTAYEFFYTEDGVLEDPVYLALAAQYKASNKLISETIDDSDELVFKRDTVWDRQESFDEFLAEWYNYRPNYLADMHAYCEEHNHVFHPERITE